MLSLKSLKLSSLFCILFLPFVLLWLDEFHCPAFEFANTFSHSSSLLLKPSVIFFSFVIVFFRSVISVCYFLIFSFPLLKFWRHSSVFPVSSVSIFVAYFVHCQIIPGFHFIKVFFWGLIVGEDYSWSLYVCLISDLPLRPSFEDKLRGLCHRKAGSAVCFLCIVNPLCMSRLHSESTFVTSSLFLSPTKLA